MKSKKSSNKSTNVSFSYIVTDDSGVVISLKQFADLHGDGDAGHGFNRSWGIGPSKAPSNGSSSFAEINRVKGFVSQSNQIICPECGKIFAETKIKKHLIDTHPNLVNSEDKEKYSAGTIKSSKTKNSSVNKFIPVQVKKCDLCEAVTKRDNFEYHVIDKHYSIYKDITGCKENDLVLCKICKAKVKPSKVRKHLISVHKINIELSKGEWKEVDSIKQTKINGGQKKYYDEYLDNLPSNKQEGNIAEAFRQAFNEARDGSKGLGHMRREWDGKFGSYPLHDDYSDEAKDD